MSLIRSVLRNNLAGTPFTNRICLLYKHGRVMQTGVLSPECLPISNGVEKEVKELVNRDSRYRVLLPFGNQRPSQKTWDPSSW